MNIIFKSLFANLCFLIALLSFTACTDYEADYEEMYGYLEEVATEELVRVTYGTLKDSRDGKAYRTITIGTQTWMAENLNYDYNEGTAKSYCYNDEESYCDKYGRLYEWKAAMAACPEDWHLPSNEEWQILVDAAGGISVAGFTLKATSGWNDGGNGSDKIGFAVLPAGYRNITGNFGNAGIYAYFWSSTENYSYNAYYWYFYYGNENVLNYWDSKYYAYSVRCLRDSNEGGEASSSSSQAQPSSSSSSVAVSHGEMTDSRDNQNYKTVTISTQTWMAENLNYNYNEGTAKSYCYENDESNCDKYGRLYLWSAAMDSAAVFSTAGKGCGYGTTCSASGTVRGVCPEGWHLPNDGEWQTLFDAVGGISVAGRVLKSTSGWNDGGNGSDKIGFAVLPAGIRGSNGYFYNAGRSAYFWSSTEYSSSDAFSWYFYYSGEGVYGSWGGKYNAYSVRCLRDSN